jgi:hypothetical protein
MTCRQSIEDGVNEKLQDRGAASVLTNLLALMNGGKISAHYLETLVGKSFHQSRYNIYDAWVFGQLHVRYFTGGLRTRFVCFRKADVTPFPDKEKAKNNEALSWLEKPFKGTFDGGLSPGDGMLEWTDSIGIRRLFQNPKTSEVREETITIEPGRWPLEVGSSSHYCTWHHMWDSWGVARWPYGQPYITLLLSTSFQEKMY